ncbi:regulatory protein GemA [Rhizobium sp. SL86]|uniref:regulatory protein GemA n=1 Tax=Rhizobium sp. SL86 TaxID=2995148 RepID=UPI002276F404|nr:regulatory protein GemA [Rhizobium sp. SL86]MCY1668608.1 regulatory protein GemA [Rhizobium sp. SL86]
MREPASPTAVTKKQIALLHVAKRDLGLDDDVYRAVLARYGKVDSAADLDLAGFNRVMKYLTACGFRSTWTKRTYGYRPTMATPPQVDLIRSLWVKWRGADDPDDAELNKWLGRFHKVGALRFVDNKKAAKVISALRAMIARRQDQN